MPTLESAARQALDDVLALKDELDETEDRLDALREDLADAGRLLEDDWTHLEARLEALQARAAEEVRHVRQGGAGTEAGLRRLEDTAEPLPGELQALVERAREEMEDFQQWAEARNAELEAKWHELEGAGEALRQRAEEVQEETARQAREAEALASAVLSGLDPFQSAGSGQGLVVSERYRTMADDFHQAREDQAARLQALHDEIRAARTSLEAELERSGEAMEEVVAAASETWLEEHERVLLELQQKTGAAAEAVADCTEEVEDQARGVAEARASLDGLNQELHGHLHSVSDAVRGVLDLLGRFSFIAR